MMMLRSAGNSVQRSIHRRDEGQEIRSDDFLALNTIAYDLFGLNLEFSPPLFRIAMLTEVHRQAWWPAKTDEGSGYEHTPPTA